MNPFELAILVLIAMLESEGDPNAINGEAVGRYQLTPICIKDLHDNYPNAGFTLECRTDPTMSAKATLYYGNLYIKRARLHAPKFGYQTDFERELYLRLTIHRQGPQGYEKATGRAYARKGMRYYRLLQQREKQALHLEEYGRKTERNNDVDYKAFLQLYDTLYKELIIDKDSDRPHTVEQADERVILLESHIQKLHVDITRLRSEKMEHLQARFLEGFRAGIREYAWWKDGVQYVGTCGKTLKEALK